MENLQFTKKSVLFALIGVLLFSLPVACGDDEPNGSGDSQTGIGVTINGIKWATRNVDKPGRFAREPEDAGMFYKWNSKKAYPSTGDVTDWDTTNSEGDIWEKANDPCPAGWRIPTYEEIDKLFNADKVSNELATINSINGRKFTDNATDTSLFLPAAGYRSNNGGMLNGAGSEGGYWSSDSREAPCITGFPCPTIFNSFSFSIFDGYHFNISYRISGLTVRCVAK